MGAEGHARAGRITYESSEVCLVRARECKLLGERAVSGLMINVKVGCSVGHQHVIKPSPPLDLIRARGPFNRVGQVLSLVLSRRVMA